MIQSQAPKSLADLGRRIVSRLGPMIRAAAPDTDNGTGPLRVCQDCGRARHDVGPFGTCIPCDLRAW
jgi:hypothetical protein